MCVGSLRTCRAATLSQHMDFTERIMVLRIRMWQRDTSLYRFGLPERNNTYWWCCLYCFGRVYKHWCFRLVAKTYAIARWLQGRPRPPYIARHCRVFKSIWSMLVGYNKIYLQDLRDILNVDQSLAHPGVIDIWPARHGAPRALGFLSECVPRTMGPRSACQMWTLDYLATILTVDSLHWRQSSLMTTSSSSLLVDLLL